MPKKKQRTPVTEEEKLVFRDMIQGLRATYEVIAEHKPLKIGIDKDLIAAHPEVPERTIKILLEWHTGSRWYRENLREMVHRYDLTGKKVGTVKPKPLSEHEKKEQRRQRIEARAAARRARKAQQKEDEGQAGDP